MTYNVFGLQVVAALKKGLVSDGPVTLVLERRVAADGHV